MQPSVWQDDLIGMAEIINMWLHKASGWKAQRECSNQQLISLVWPEEMKCNII